MKILEYFTAYNNENILYKIKEQKEGFNFSITTDGNGIYHDSRKRAMTKVPYEIDFNFSFNDSVELLSYFIEASSKYFIEKNYYKNSEFHIMNINSYVLKINKIDNLFGKRERLQVSVNENDVEIFCFRITKITLIYLSYMIRNILDNQILDERSFLIEINRKFNVKVSTSKSGLKINNLTLAFKDNIYTSLFSNSILTHKGAELLEGIGKYFSYFENKVSNEIEVFISKIKNTEETYSFNATPYFVSVLFLLNKIDTSLNYNHKTNKDVKLDYLKDLKITSAVNFNGYLAFSASAENYNAKEAKGLPIIHISADNFKSTRINFGKDFFNIFSKLINPMTEEDFTSTNRTENVFGYKSPVYEGIYTKELRTTLFQKKGKDYAFSISKRYDNKVEEKYFTSMPSIKTLQLKYLLVEITKTIKNFYFFIKHKSDENIILKIGNKDGKVRVYDSDTEKEFFKILDNSDILKLYLSAYSKLINGYWLAFQGELISINNYSCLNTIKREYHLNSDGANGCLNALRVIALTGEYI